MIDSDLPTLADVTAAVQRRWTTANLSGLEEAFRIAERVHQGERRRSGHPYIVHPLAVALLLAEWGCTPFAVALGLLHDVPDSVGITDDLRALVGEQGVRVLESVHSLDTQPDAALEQLRVKFAEDPETLDLVVRIKLADRTHNARTWRFVPRQRAVEKARQTRQAMVPLARTLGLQVVADELERLSAGYLGEPAGPSAPVERPDAAGELETGLGEDRVAAGLLRRALELLPAHERSRYASEWTADLAVTRGRRQRLLLAAGFVYSARRLGRDRLRAEPVFERPSR